MCSECALTDRAVQHGQHATISVGVEGVSAIRGGVDYTITGHDEAVGDGPLLGWVVGSGASLGAPLAGPAASLG